MPLEKDDEVDVLRDIQRTLKEGFARPRQADDADGSGGGSSPADKAKKK
jgi:hypothetical protein